MAGRRSKPTHLKLITGNPGKKPINRDEPKPEVGIPEMPPNLSYRARQEWPKFIKIINDMGVLTVADGAAMAQMCETFAELSAAREALYDLDGVFCPTFECRTKSDGIMIRKRPEMDIVQDADRRFRAYLCEFGLTPSSRSKLHVAKKDDKEEDLAQKYFG